MHCSGSASLADLLIAAANSRSVIRILEPDDWVTRSIADLVDDAVGRAGILQSRGVLPGERILLAGRTSYDFVATLLAAILSGATVIVLGVPPRLHSASEVVETISSRALAADARFAIIDEDSITVGATLLPHVRTMGLRSVAGSGRFDAPEIDPNSLALLQFTSGSTRDPRAVMLPHTQVRLNIMATVEAAGLRDSDTVVSWLPLHHDMGLIGFFLLPVLFGMNLVLMDSSMFARAPGMWMSAVSRYGATVTAAPNFAYGLAARELDRDDALDLSHLRVAFNGAEPIDPDTVDRFVESGARCGLQATAPYCVYGLAEATLAVAFPEPGTAMERDRVKSTMLLNERVAMPAHDRTHPTLTFARLGRPIPNTGIEVIDDQGDTVPERRIGEVVVTGPCVSPGYFKNDADTQAVFRDGRLYTGDLGYLVNEELVICGRLKDIIIVGGRNVAPDELERAVMAVPGVRLGNAIAFGVVEANRERVIVVLEATGRNAEVPSESEVRRTVVRATGVDVDEVVILERGALPKTSSGKLARSLCKDLYLDSALPGRLS
jgi:fatty-acyl-CoA synthase